MASTDATVSQVMRAQADGKKIGDTELAFDPETGKMEVRQRSHKNNSDQRVGVTLAKTGFFMQFLADVNPELQALKRKRTSLLQVNGLALNW
eukprot:m.260623 g.260623  ORF g.260623 m.260623 type:complete len:92 (+) comp40438_c0_seq2:1554-1829(+)